MNQEVYEYLKKIYNDVVYYDYLYICQQEKKIYKYRKYTRQDLLDEANEETYLISNVLYGEINSEYIDIFETKHTKDRHFNEIFKDWIDYKIITKEQNDFFIQRIFESMIKTGDINVSDNLILRPIK